MLIGLYTSRAILKALGFDNYGIYNVVGGFVGMFAILSGSLSSSISRFMTFELGKNGTGKLRTTFSSAVSIQLLLSLLIIVIGETIGLWFFYNKMDIPPQRIQAAMWVFQISIVNFCLDLVAVPYTAAIIAHEKMSTFAYISITDAVIKLIIVFLLFVSPMDNLIFYAILMACDALLFRIISGVYCKRHFAECSYRPTINKPLLKEMFGFAGWTFFGSGSYLFVTQGINVLMNTFFGVVLNAARGIATQVEGIITNFVNNFTMSVNPQITKSYSSGEFDYMYTLVCKGAKFSYFLFLFLMLPMVIETDEILHLWLGEYPPYTVIFLRLTLATSAIAVMSNSMVTAILATGKIKKYQIVVGALGFLAFAVVYVLYKIGLPPYTSYYVIFLLFVSQLTVKFIMVKELTGMPAKRYITEVLVKILVVTAIASILPILCAYCLQPSLLRTIYVVLLCTASSAITIYALGLTNGERSKIVYKLSSLYKERLTKRK